MEVFKTVVLSTVLYGSEIWAPIAMYPYQASVKLHHEVCMRHSRSDKVGQEEEHMYKVESMHAMAGFRRVEVMLMR